MTSHKIIGRLRKPSSVPKIKARMKPRPALSELLFDAAGNITGIPRHHMLSLPDGTPLNAAVIPNFCQDYLGIDHTEIWKIFEDMPQYDTDADLDAVFDKDDGWNTKLLPGAHPALNYRGKPVARTKFWLQDDFDKGMLRYGYTGWQWRTALAQRRIESVPLIDQMNKKLNTRMPDKLKCNHVIGTMYVDGQDYIGQHSDKIKDFEENSGFIVIKLGCARRFQFATKDGDVFYDQRLEPGTAVIVGHSANTETVHAVPKDHKCNGTSGSVVFRKIKTQVPWHKAHTKIRAANYT